MLEVEVVTVCDQLACSYGNVLHLRVAKDRTFSRFDLPLGARRGGDAAKSAHGCSKASAVTREWPRGLAWPNDLGPLTITEKCEGGSKIACLPEVEVLGRIDQDRNDLNGRAMSQKEPAAVRWASGPNGGWGSAGGSAPGCFPQLHEQEQGGDGGGGGEGDEEEVDEGVHAREQNTGGGTSAGGGLNF